MAVYQHAVSHAPDRFFPSSSRWTSLRPAMAAHSRAVVVLSMKASSASAEKASGGGDTKHSAWANIRQERWEGDLAIEGNLPLWLNGTYLRNGPGLWDVGAHAAHHLFDGYATLVRVSFRQGSASGGHRQVQSDAYKGAKARGRPVLGEFSHRPRPPPANLPLLGALRSIVGLLTGAGSATLSDNPNIAVLPLGDGRVVCLTETTRSSTLVDPGTLDTLGKFHYADKLRGMMVQSGHPMVMNGSSELLTLLPDFLRRSHLVVRMDAGSNERKVVGRVSCRGGPTPAWVHSFAVTEKYVVVPEMPLRYSSARLLQSKLAQFYVFDWLPASGSYMHVMCRSTGRTVSLSCGERRGAALHGELAMHFINAYEEKRQDDGQAAAVIVDCCEHFGDPAIIDALVMHRLRSFGDKDVLPDARVGRFRIPLDGSPFGELESALDPDSHGRGIDMCVINPAYLGREYRYTYGCSASRPCNFPNSLAKIDLVDRTAKSWHEEGAVPSEPFFVARPGAMEEDDGAVISIVSTVHGDSYVLVLDGMMFEEIARVKFPYGHMGCHTASTVAGSQSTCKERLCRSSSGGQGARDYTISRPK